MTLDREKVLERFTQELERITAAVVFDLAARTAEAGQPEVTDFLDPFQQRVAEKVLHCFKELKFTVWGGYPEAERARLLLYPKVLQAGADRVPLAFLEITPAGDVHTLSHRDYLGAILSLGLRREKIGDLLLTAEGGAQLIISPEMSSFLQANLSMVGRTPVKLRGIAQHELAPAALSAREIRATVASLRLDAVASAGFGLSRSKLAQAVRAGQVKLNWQSVKNPSAPVKEGDCLSLAGRGRLEVASIMGESRSGRHRLLLKKHC